MVAIEDSGRQNDDSVYSNSYLGHAIVNNLLNLQSRKLPNSEGILHFVFIGDDAFGFKDVMMKPYPFLISSLERMEYLIIEHQEQGE